MTKKQKRMLAAILISAVLFVVAWLVPVRGPWKAAVFAFPYLIVGLPVLKNAVMSVFRGQLLDENFLMAIASVGAFILGEYPEGVAVVLFYRVGELFESCAVGKSRKSVAELMTLCPDEATVFREGKWVTLSPDDVEIGQSVRVLPGEKIPLDGTVIEGASSLDTRSLTGESVPRDVTEGDSVFSGCVNLSGVLVLRVEKSFGESTASKILSLVEDAAAHRSKSESFVTSFARWYTPTVIGVAVLVGILPPLFGGEWSVWIYRALEFLVGSCPCALVISVPLTYFGGIGGASRKGILVKGSDRLEALAKTDVMVFDKTGTLTHGIFEVVSVEGESPEKILEIAALCEQFSTHPIARSLREKWGGRVSEDRVSHVEEIAGFGVCAKVDGVQYYVGNESLMRQKRHSPTFAQTIGTRIFVASDTECFGVITISDRLKDNASAALSALRRLGIRRTVMLTGDGVASAQSIASQVGIGEARANLLPQDKVSALREISADTKGTVAFVGDGMNDAPVLTAADIGIAMGGLGSDAAIEAADVVLMHDDLSALPQGILLARKTHRIVMENMFFSIAIKILVMFLCALGVANMWHAVFADVGVSVLAILNALRTLSRK